MENLKFSTFLVIILISVALLGYWAFSTIEPGNVHVDRQKQKELEQQNEELEEKIDELEKKLASFEALEEERAEALAMPPEENSTTNTASSTHQNLIDALQKLIDEKVFMKEKSRGTRVGTIQTFLNLYNNTSQRIDNDYGKTTKAAVAKFQKDVGLTADGETGPSTYAKMIEWLEKQ